MAERTTRTQEIFLGDEIIIGELSYKSGKPYLINPKAEVTVPNKNIKVSLDGDVGKIKPTANIKYQEATTEKDTAHFLLEIFKDNNLIGGAQTNSKDTPARENKFEGQISSEIDLTKWSGKTIQLKAHLKCWLEETPWVLKGSGSTVAASAEDWVNIILDVPEIKKPKQDPIIHFNVIGRALRKGEKEEDYAHQNDGKEYGVITTIINSTNNKINYGELDFYENSNLLSDLPSGITEIKQGQIYPITLKFTKYWPWYKTEEDGRLTVADIADRTFNYALDYYLRDEYGYEWKSVIDGPSKAVKIVVGIPKYKVDSVGVYNNSFDAESQADLASLILDIDLILIGAGVGYLFEEFFGALIGAVAGAGTDLLGLRIGDNIAKLATGKTVGGWAQELRVKLKKVIDDPPKFDKKYRQVAPIKQIRFKPLQFKSKHEELWGAFIKSHSLIVPAIDAMLIASDRAWSAEKKKDGIAVKKQKKAFNKHKGNLVKNLRTLSQHVAALAKFWSKFKIDVAEFINLKRTIKRRGLPTTIKLQLKRNGVSNKKIKRLENLISAQRIGKLNASKTYRDYAKNLQILASSIEEWTT